MVVEFIKDAWKAYKRNLGTIILSIIVLGLIFFFIAAPFSIPLIKFLTTHDKELKALNSLTAENFRMPDGGYALNLLLQLISSASIFIVGLLFTYVITYPLKIGLIRVYYEALKGKSSIRTMFKTGGRKFWPAIGLKVLVSLIMLGALIVLGIIIFPISLLSVFLPQVVFAILILGLIAFALFKLFFNLVAQAMVVHNSGVIESVKKSFNTVRLNFIDYFALVLIFFVFSAILQLFGYIPLIGLLFGLALSLLVKPMADLSYTSFYIKRAKKRK